MTISDVLYTAKEHTKGKTHKWPNGGKEVRGGGGSVALCLKWICRMETLHRAPRNLSEHGSGRSGGINLETGPVYTSSCQLYVFVFAASCARATYCTFRICAKINEA